VDPPLNAVYEVAVPPLSDTIRFSVAFRADDLGEQVRFAVVRDLDPTIREVDWEIIEAANLAVDPRPYFQQSERELGFDLPVDGDLRFCHSVTLILTYASNVPLVYKPSDPSQVAQVTWWVDFGDGEGNRSSIGTCPPIQEPP
jgi:hypothetical protein